jgi:alkylation response protein AidB-like acyl-CoA dehydrogenase
LYPIGDVLLDDVRLPTDHLLGVVDGAWGSLIPLIQEAVDYPATSLGMSKAMYAIAHDYARDRVQGGRPIVEHPTIGSRLAEMRMQIATMEAYIRDTARAIAGPKPYDPEHTWLCKVHCDRATVDVMLGALEVTGGNGVMAEFPLERFCRDVLTSLHSDGTETLNLLRAARGIAEESRTGR